jgi:hypothetical protein
MDIMPSIEECIAGLEALPDHGKKWLDFQHAWFYEGLSSDTTMGLVYGIDPAKVFRHLSVIQGSYQPSHQHKQAAVAYLASRWLTDIQY